MIEERPLYSERPRKNAKIAKNSERKKKGYS